MKDKITCTVLCFLLSCSMVCAQSVSEVWVADQGNGYYINPILHADYSDPDVCAVGGDFYLTASSFNCIPGLPVLHSKDLVNWQIINHALKTPQEPVDFFNTPQHGRGVWAPCIRHHKGEFYIYWGDPDFGIYMVKTHNPAATWENPVLVKAGKGMIDPTPLWDDDGKAYLAYAWAGSRAGINSIIVISEMNAGGTKVISDPVLVFDGNDGVNHTIEGPKLYKRNGYYYLFAPAGGVETGWQLALRSKNVYGPYHSKVVMAQGETTINGPHQGGWVDTPTGESWFINFQDKGAYGRVIHLNPMAWVNDWPVIGEDKDGDGCGEPVGNYKKPNVGANYPVATPADSDEFNDRHLGRQWQWHANYQDLFGFPSDLGFMRIYGYTLSAGFVNFWEVPNLLMQKFPAEEFTATAKLCFTTKEEGSKAGIIIMGWDYSYLSVSKQGNRFVLQQSICKDAEQKNPERIIELTELPVSTTYEAGLFPNYVCHIYMRVEVTKNGMCQFLYSVDGKEHTAVGEPFKARVGKWIGAKAGLFCVNPDETNNRAWLDVDWFRVTKQN